jgi:hypothetical protein
MDPSLWTKPSLTLRIGIGKAAGFSIGLAGFILLPVFAPDAGWMIRWGILLWYTTLGAIIGIFGVYTYHPVLRLPMPWWVRAPFLGAWMNFVLTFFAYDDFKTMMVALLGTSAGLMTSPFWFALEGALVGLIIGWLATRFGGEGPESASS